MSQYSEVLGSFIRVGNFPLEANYVFPSERALKDFYSDELNKTILHDGLLKVVVKKDKQTLYWVVNINPDSENPEYEFLPLLSSDSFEDLIGQINLLREDLNSEISDRKDSILELLGTDNLEEFENDLTNILALSKAVSELLNFVNNNQELLDTCAKFFDGFDFDNQFNLNFKTLKNIKDFVTKFRGDFANLWTELNLTQNGIGLDSSGLYSPDSETNYLKLATSVMNALRTLDAKIKEALEQKGSVIERGYYDSSKEALILVFKGEDSTLYEIPVRDLIDEWEISNEDGVVILNKNKVETDGPDILSADVRISTKEDNALLKDGNSLYVPVISGPLGPLGELGPQGPQGVIGLPGKDGVNGISCTHSWEGTTLTITSASGTSSANLQGPQGIQGIQGEKGDKGDVGPQGDKGDPGLTTEELTNILNFLDLIESINSRLDELEWYEG